MNSSPVQSPYTFQSKIKIFSDGADRASLLEMNGNPKIAGMTTNPSLMRKAGVTDYRGYCKEILTHVTEKPISFEVFADEIAEMRRQALEIKTWGKNVYVKIPITNSKGESCLPLVKELSHSGVKLNITALFTVDQVKGTCDAVKGGAPAFVSVFAGRLADTGVDPMPLMKASLELCRAAGPDVELLWASTREVYNIVQAEQMGCHIITAPADIIKKLHSGFGKTAEALSLDTVQTFKKDSEAAGFKL
ncbi:MAG: transaldolase [Bdellovibrionales bacterium]|nr:transaldolase [Bdellovibrionales bacterium]